MNHELTTAFCYDIKESKTVRYVHKAMGEKQWVASLYTETLLETVLFVVKWRA